MLKQFPLKQMEAARQVLWDARPNRTGEGAFLAMQRAWKALEMGSDTETALREALAAESTAPDDPHVRLFRALVESTHVAETAPDIWITLPAED